MSKILTEDIIPTLKQKVEETASGVAGGKLDTPTDSVVLGTNASPRPGTINPVSIGEGSQVSGDYGVALGAFSSAGSRTVSVGGSTLDGRGYNSTNYRLITNVHDPVSAQDAATKNYVDTATPGWAYYDSKSIKSLSQTVSTSDPISNRLKETACTFSGTPVDGVYMLTCNVARLKVTGSPIYLVLNVSGIVPGGTVMSFHYPDGYDGPVSFTYIVQGQHYPTEEEEVYVYFSADLDGGASTNVEFLSRASGGYAMWWKIVRVS